MIAAAPLVAKLAFGEASSLFSSWTGGSARDAARAARAQYFTNAAEQGSVMAARCILGGVATVSSNEKSMYDTAEQAVEADRPDVMASARAQGPYWSLSDSAESYPVMRGLVESDLGNVARASSGAGVGDATRLPTMTTTARAPAPASSSGTSPWLFVAIAAALALLAIPLLMRKR